ncbi:MAG: type II toxin-antitoxin system RelE/ParE family toxin [Pirellulaceae bacterium]
MARVVVTPTALDDLDRLIRELKLPGDTRSRVRDRLRQLAEFPESGEELTGRWAGFRYLLGPWPWMLIVCMYDEGADRVSVVTIQDSRAARSATSQR